MKMNILSINIIAALLFSCLVFMIPEKAAGLDIAIGATAWYAQWDSVWREIPVYRPLPGWSSRLTSREGDNTPTLLYGPVFSIGFSSDVSIAGAYLWGDSYRLKQESVYDAYNEMGAYQFTGISQESIGPVTRFDYDTTLNYRVFPWLKVFAGVKYQGYDYDINIVGTVPLYLMDYFMSVTVKSRSLGPGAGAGITLPVFSHAYMMVNASFLYLRTTWEYSNYIAQNYDPMIPEEVDFRCYGFNAHSSLVYYFEEANIALSLGVRLQYLRFTSKDAEKNGIDERAYGITGAAVFSFHI